MLSLEIHTIGGKVIMALVGSESSVGRNPRVVAGRGLRAEKACGLA